MQRHQGLLRELEKLAVDGTTKFCVFSQNYINEMSAFLKIRQVISSCIWSYILEHMGLIAI